MKWNIHLFRFFLLLIAIILTTESMGQQQLITGRVVDQLTGEPLTGVTIFIKNTTLGTTTDYNGNYSINAEKGQILVYSFVGYTREEIEVTDEGFIPVQLSPQIETLSEMVVIGYGTQKKSDLTGAVTSVSVDELLKIPTGNIANALQGNASGVIVSRATGAPGARTDVRIRGISSFTGGNALWIIDGVPGNPNSLNMNDIESMEILKDASTAAIYGSAGANGVILITTKKGKKGTELSVNSYYGVQSIARTLELANGPQAAHYIHEAENIVGYAPRRQRFHGVNIDTLPSFDHVAAMFRMAPIHSHNLSLSHGGENGTAYFSAGYFAQDGIVYNSNYQRLNVRLNSEYRVRDWLSVGERLSFEYSQNQGFDEWALKSEYHGPIIHAATFMPYMPLFTPDGEYISDGFGHSNPQATLDHTSNRFNYNNHGSGTIYAILSPLKGLSLTSNLTGNVGVSDNKTFTDIFRVLESSQRNERMTLNAGMSKSYGWRAQNIANYTTTFADRVNFSAMAGIEAGYGKWINYFGTRKDLFNNTPQMWYPNASIDASVDTMVTPSRFFQGSGAENSFYSYFGRISMDYRSKYLVQFNLRNDQSSRFGPDNRSGYFPSFSTGWKFSEEAFMDQLPWISFGKVRYGWGKAGNDNISPYGFYTTVGFNPTLDASFNSGGQILIGAAPNQLVNREVHWETIVTTNLGIDLGFLDDRLFVNMDYFTRQNEGMLMRVRIPDLAGWATPWGWQEHGGIEPVAFSNIGVLRNSGFEFTTSYREYVNPRFSFNIQANYTFVRNEVIDIKGDTLYNGAIRGVTGFLARTFAGGGIGDFYGRVVDKIFQESDGYFNSSLNRWVMTNQPFNMGENGDTLWAQPLAEPGDYKWSDINGDGRIDDKDRKVIGNPHPKHLVGFNFNFTWGLLDFSMFWQGAFGHQILNGLYANLLGESTDGSKNLPLDFINNHYRNDVFDREGNLLYAQNHNAKYARFDIRNTNQNYNTFSDIYIENGDYMRLKTLMIGVRIPDNWQRSMNVGTIRLFVNMTNLITFTRYSGLDPELDTSNPLFAGIDTGVYPVARTFTAGIDIRF